jgi:hypothetical protein
VYSLAAIHHAAGQGLARRLDPAAGNDRIPRCLLHSDADRRDDRENHEVAKHSEYVADSSGTTSAPSPSSGPEQYVADLAFTTADDVDCENGDQTGTGSGYFCGVSSTYDGKKDYMNPPTCYHVFKDNSGWSAYSDGGSRGSLPEAPVFCPSGWGWSTVG